MPKRSGHIVAFIKKHNPHIDRNIITYLVCVIIATILWLINALNKDYTAEIAYPVKYTDLPKGKHLISDLPQEIVLEVKAKGFALLGHKISTSFLPITFNVNSYSNHKLEKNDLFEYTLNTNEMKDKINDQLNVEIKLQRVTPETIEFKFTPSVSKKIAVSPNVKYTLKRQYILKDKIKTQPDSIIVSGPAIIMDTLSCIRTKSLNLNEIGKNISKDIDLLNIPGCDFDETKVQLNIQVEQFTESKRTIQITEINVPDSLNLRLFPNDINITYDIGLSQYDKISDADFIFSVDYKQCVVSSFLDVKVKKIPGFIKDLVFTPKKVEYILEHKSTIQPENQRLKPYEK